MTTIKSSSFFADVFKYNEDGLDIYFHHASEIEPYIKLESYQGKITKFTKSYFYDPIISVTYLYYENDRVVQSIDSVANQISVKSLYEYDPDGNMIRKSNYMNDSYSGHVTK